MEKKWNKKYIAECVRKKHPRVGDIRFDSISTLEEDTDTITRVYALKVRFIKRNGGMGLTFLMLDDNDYNPSMLYKRNIVYNPYKGRAW